ncbi:Glycosyl transferase, family 25 [uncultured Caudovirales phage]|uniref:Glycosyl transferase, family 25 n=1 Tax=uncultured Caudovirales phage TaxID=2100421 RepID=A0A6J5KM12_9CAUD|nr:Glycosyl transferase, family 25 [uncultured Caudovirales phage]
MSKILYKIFHSTEVLERTSYVEAATNTLNRIGEPLDTPTIIINSPETLKKFLSEEPYFAKNLNLKGYDPREHGKKNNPALKSTNIRIGWKYGEIGVWASNYMAWKKFLASDADYLILAEDDVIFNVRAVYLFNTYIKELPEDWDQFHFWPPPEDNSSYLEAEHGISKAYVCKTYQDWSNACYILTKNGAKKLIESLETQSIHLPLDWHWFKIGYKYGLNSYTIKPDADPICRVSTVLPSTFQYDMRRTDLTGFPPI